MHADAKTWKVENGMTHLDTRRREKAKTPKVEKSPRAPAVRAENAKTRKSENAKRHQARKKNRAVAKNRKVQKMNLTFKKKKQKKKKKTICFLFFVEFSRSLLGLCYFRLFLLSFLAQRDFLAKRPSRVLWVLSIRIYCFIMLHLNWMKFARMKLKLISQERPHSPSAARVVAPGSRGRRHVLPQDSMKCVANHRIPSRG